MADELRVEVSCHMRYMHPEHNWDYKQDWGPQVVYKYHCPGVRLWVDQPDIETLFEFAKARARRSGDSPDCKCVACRTWRVVQKYDRE